MLTRQEPEDHENKENRGYIDTKGRKQRTSDSSDQNLNIFLKSSPMTYCQMLMIVLSLRLSMPLRMSFVSLGASASSEDIAYVGSAVGTAWGHGDLDFHMCSIPPERRVSPK